MVRSQNDFLAGAYDDLVRLLKHHKPVMGVEFNTDVTILPTSHFVSFMTGTRASVFSINSPINSIDFSTLCPIFQSVG